MLVSRVPARARRVRRRLALRWCRHEISQPRPGRIRNDQSRMSPSPQPIASAHEPGTAGRAEALRRDADGRSTIARPIPARTRPRPGGRSPRSAPWRAAWASHPNTPPSRRSGRPQGSPGGRCGPCGSGSPGSRLTAAQPAQGRRDARIAVRSRSGLRSPYPGSCSGRGSWHPLPLRNGNAGRGPLDHPRVNRGGRRSGNRQREHGPSPEPITRRPRNHGRPLADPASDYPWSVLWRAADDSAHVQAVVDCAQAMSKRLGWLTTADQTAH